MTAGGEQQPSQEARLGWQAGGRGPGLVAEASRGPRITTPQERSGGGGLPSTGRAGEGPGLPLGGAFPGPARNRGEGGALLPPSRLGSRTGPSPSSPCAAPSRKAGSVFRGGAWEPRARVGPSRAARRPPRLVSTARGGTVAARGGGRGGLLPFPARQGSRGYPGARRVAVHYSSHQPQAARPRVWAGGDCSAGAPRAKAVHARSPGRSSAGPRWLPGQATSSVKADGTGCHVAKAVLPPSQPWWGDRSSL